MKILIASGIYPPDIGGPAQYARNLYETWKKQGHDVKVAAYRWERAFPPLVRHIFYFLKIIRKGWNADLILVLDTWSAAVPAMYACKLMHKKYSLRTGGDFLWESYVERTGDLVFLKDFYAVSMDKLSRKEKLVFKLGGASLRNAHRLIFSTNWQKGIFEPAYKLDTKKSRLVENYCGKREAFIEPENRTFVAGARPLKWKNTELVKEAFEEARMEVKRLGLPDIELDCGKAVYDSFVEKIHRSYAVILASLGDISPNMILDAVRVGTPFIVTKENGITHLIKDAAVFVDPKSKKDIVEKIVWLADPNHRAEQARKVQALSFAHSWEQIAGEIMKIHLEK
jgi:glycosyltransferase involved in cell wall biosynthesis